VDKYLRDASCGMPGILFSFLQKGGFSLQKVG
jgi:hypothetical protein